MSTTYCSRIAPHPFWWHGFKSCHAILYSQLYLAMTLGAFICSQICIMLSFLWRHPYRQLTWQTLWILGSHQIILILIAHFCRSWPILCFNMLNYMLFTHISFPKFYTFVENHMKFDQLRQGQNSKMFGMSVCRTKQNNAILSGFPWAHAHGRVNLAYHTIQRIKNMRERVVGKETTLLYKHICMYH